jgi:hypothetical protein
MNEIIEAAIKSKIHSKIESLPDVSYNLFTVNLKALRFFLEIIRLRNMTLLLDQKVIN